MEMLLTIESKKDKLEYEVNYYKEYRPARWHKDKYRALPTLHIVIHMDLRKLWYTKLV